jgi:hypothetical protein
MSVLNVNTVDQNETSSGSRRPLHTDSRHHLQYWILASHSGCRRLYRKPSFQICNFNNFTVMCSELLDIPQWRANTNTMNLLRLFLNGYQYQGFLCLVYIFPWVSLLSNANSVCETSALLCTSLLWKALHTQNISNEIFLDISSTTKKKSAAY